MAERDNLFSNIADEDSFLGILVKFGDRLQKELKKSLSESGENGSASDLGTLEQSIQPKVTPLGGGKWRFEIWMEEYGAYIDLGVQGIGGTRATDSPFRGKKGQAFRNKAPNSPFKFKKNKMPHGDFFEGWAHRKGLDKWAVAQAVWRTGIRPNEFISKVFTPEIEKEFTDLIETRGAAIIEKGIVNNIVRSTFK